MSIANIYDPWNNPIIKTRILRKRKVPRKGLERYDQQDDDNVGVEHQQQIQRITEQDLERQNLMM